MPHAGAGASAFRGWAQHLGPEIETTVVQLPGREARYGEAPYTLLEDLVSDLAEALLPYLKQGSKVALFGNSFGALVAFETLQEIRRRSGLEAAHLFVSAKAAPHLPPLLPPVGSLPDRALAREVSERYGAIPAPVLADEGYLAMVLAALRSDLGMLESYDRRTPQPLSCPVTAFGGTRDRTLPAGHIDAWSEQTLGCFRKIELKEDHLYLQSAREQLVRHIRESLLASL